MDMDHAARKTNRAVFITVLVVLVLTIVAVIVSVSVLATDDGNSSGPELLRAAWSENEVVPRDELTIVPRYSSKDTIASTVTASLATEKNVDHVFMTEVEFVPSKGAFMLSLDIEGQTVRGVLDSGSSSLVLNGVECQGCVADFGALSHTIPMRSSEDKSKYVLNYGSQSVVAVRKKKDVVVPKSVKFHSFAWDSLFRVKTSSKLLNSLCKPTPLPLSSVDTYVATTMSGPTRMNIVGIVPKRSVTSSDFVNCLSDHVSSLATSSSAWSVMFGPRSGVYGVGEPMTIPKGCGSKTLPIVVPKQLHGAHTSFVTLRIVDILVDEAKEFSSARSIFSKPSPSDVFLLLDTGTTCVYTSSNLKGPLAAAGVRGSVFDTRHILIRLDGGVDLPLHPEDYLLNGRTESFLMTDTQIVDSIFQGMTGILFGCVGMMGHHWEVNETEGTVRLTSAPECVAQW